MTGAGVKLVRTGEEQASLGYTFSYSSDFFFTVVKYSKIYHFNHFQSIQFSSMCNRHQTYASRTLISFPS